MEEANRLNAKASTTRYEKERILILHSFGGIIAGAPSH
jgi:hypothetical protein